MAGRLDRRKAVLVGFRIADSSRRLCLERLRRPANSSIAFPTPRQKNATSSRLRCSSLDRCRKNCRADPACRCGAGASVERRATSTGSAMLRRARLPSATSAACRFCAPSGCPWRHAALDQSTSLGRLRTAVEDAVVAPGAPGALLALVRFRGNPAGRVQRGSTPGRPEAKTWHVFLRIDARDIDVHRCTPCRLALTASMSLEDQQQRIAVVRVEAAPCRSWLSSSIWLSAIARNL